MSLRTLPILLADRMGILFTLISLIEKGDNRYKQTSKRH